MKAILKAKKVHSKFLFKNKRASQLDIRISAKYRGTFATERAFKLSLAAPPFDSFCRHFYMIQQKTKHHNLLNISHQQDLGTSANGLKILVVCYKRCFLRLTLPRCTTQSVLKIPAADYKVYRI